MHFSSALTSYSIKGNVSVFIKVKRGLLVCRLERNKFARLKKRLEGLEQIMGIKEKAIFVVFRCLFRSITFSFGFFLLFSSIFHLFTSFLTTWTLYNFFFLFLILVYTFSLPPLLIPAWVTVNCFPFFVNSSQFYVFFESFWPLRTRVCVRKWLIAWY